MIVLAPWAIALLDVAVAAAATGAASAIKDQLARNRKRRNRS